MAFSCRWPPPYISADSPNLSGNSTNRSPRINSEKNCKIVQVTVFKDFHLPQHSSGIPFALIMKQDRTRSKKSRTGKEEKMKKIVSYFISLVSLTMMFAMTYMLMLAVK